LVWFGLVGWLVGRKERLARADSVKKWSSGFVRYAMNIQRIFQEKVFWKMLSKNKRGIMQFLGQSLLRSFFWAHFAAVVVDFILVVGILISSHMSMLSQGPLQKLKFFFLAQKYHPYLYFISFLLMCAYKNSLVTGERGPRKNERS